MGQWFSNALFASPGLLIGAFSFVTTNIGADPDMTLSHGCGGLSGGDGASTGATANGGPTFVSSITKTANAGEFLVTFKEGYRAVWHADAECQAAEAGPADGYGAQVCKPANQGSGRETAVTMLVTVLDENRAVKETAGRTVSCFVVLKTSGAGS